MLIDILKVIFLSVVEGLTEFLPVSSTGHMIIVDDFLKLSDNKSFTDSFMIIIQLGAIFSVLVYFWNELWPFSGSKQARVKKFRLWRKVIVAVMPAVVLGLLFDDFIEEKLFNPMTVSIALIFYGIILIVLEIKNSKKIIFRVDSIEKITYFAAFSIGFFQCLAMVPGTSRSAATIIGAMLMGFNRSIAAEFSFFLAIPTMLGASLLKIVKTGLVLNFYEWFLIALGFIASFLVALVVINYFMDYIKRKDFKIFAYYRIVLGIIVLLILVL